MNQLEILKDLTKLYNMEDRQGYVETYIKDVMFFKITSNEDIMPLLYHRGFSFIGFGKKVGYIQDKKFEHNSNDFLMITSPQPIECETFTYDDCMMGVYINLDMVRLNKINLKIGESCNFKTNKKDIPFSVVKNKRTQEIEEVYLKLIKTLLNPIDSKILGDYILDELYYRMLTSENGEILKQLCEQDSNFSKVANIVEFIHNNLKEKISADDLSRMADMSVNNLHKIFKKAMNDTPIQYIKKIRLNKARQLLLYEKMKAIDVSYEVGYESPTQFNREFKRYFGVTPSKIDTLGYKNF